MTNKALLIAGPTASGKSRLALDLARRLGGMVINADSMQVYRDLKILTARPDAQAEALAPHRLYGALAADDVCSAARWTAMARASMTEAWSQGLLPIVVGGTGLYLRALTDGLADIPPVPDEIRDAARARMAQLGPERFFADLNARNPRAVLGLRPTDSQRLVRAAEVFEATGRPLVDFHSHEKPAADTIGWTQVALMPDRAALHRAIEGRFDAMIEVGALDEAASMRALKLDPSLPLAKTLGLRPLIAHLDGEISLDDAKTRAKIDTRRYAKRQMTWIRTQMIAWKVLNSQDSERNCTEICTFMEN